MAQLQVTLSAFKNYGVSTVRTGFTAFTGNGGFTGDGGLDGTPYGGMLKVLDLDLKREWQLYNGIPQSGNEVVDAADGSTLVTKRFFDPVFPVAGYDGTPSYGTTDDGQPQLQHVIVYDSTDQMSPNQGQVSRGIDQKFRLRLEYDERPRLFESDKEFSAELYQLNLKMRNLGLDTYSDGNAIDETLVSTWGETLVNSHPGYGTVTNASLEAGWEATVGIPNPSYAWLKINIATKNQILDNGDITAPLGISDGLITLENGASVSTSILRDPGQCVDLFFEDIVIPEDGGTINRSTRWRNKRRGKGWFKRFPKQDSSVAGTYPMQYRITFTERGFCFFIMDDSSTDQNDDYAWVLAQRTVDNQTGITRTDESSRFPLHCMYSCSRESVSPRDFGVYFTQQAANLQTAANAIGSVYDESGNEFSVSELNSDSLYILNPYDREDSLADEFMAKNIWRFVAREFDIVKPWDVHKDCTRHQTDSNAIINPMEQLAITDDNRFVITFPTGLTTQRYMYPKEEIDLIAFSSSEVVAQSSNVPMQTYKPDGTNTDSRRYQGMLSTLPNGNGMRVLMLVNGDYIFNSDVNID